jgi:hypothetical protein
MRTQQCDAGPLCVSHVQNPAWFIKTSLESNGNMEIHMDIHMWLLHHHRRYGGIVAGFETACVLPSR